MNLFLHEINSNKRSLMIWTIILLIFVAAVMFMYPTLSRESTNLENMIKGMPIGMQSFYTALGFQKVSMNNIFGYYSMYVNLFITLLGSIYAILLSAALLSKEESDKTIEFLLAKPISRKEIVTNKLFSYVVNLLILNLATTVTLFITFQLVKPEAFSLLLFFLLCLASLLLHLTFAAIGFFISVFLRKNKTVLSASLGIVLITYFLGIVSEISPKIAGLQWLSPFKYVDSTDIIVSGKFETKYIVLIVLINLICISLTYFFYEKKDISV